MSLRYRRTDSEGDYTFGAKDNYIKDLDAATQAIKTRLTLLQGEWWEDLENGTPYFQHILGTSGSRESIQGIDLLIQERILTLQEVTSIEEFESNFDSENRTYSVTCKVNTIYGQAELEVTL